MPLPTIYAERVWPSGAIRLHGLHESRLFLGYTLREAKRAYRDEFRKLNGGDEFKNAKGELTPYAFACGYVETHGRFRLHRDGAAYVVDGLLFRESFATLTEARRAARRLSKGRSKCCNAVVLWLPCSGCGIANDRHEFGTCQKCGGDA